MTRQLATYITLAAFAIISSRPAAANIGDIIVAYDTVDAVEVVANQISVTGIVTGEGAPSRRTFSILANATGPGSSTQTDVAASRCDRLALLAMSKPGKFQFAIVDVGSSSRFGCKLTLRTP
ncbi:MAG TPA: hypothetical protein VFD36_28710 [Kofleriaceae bacterium]|nr:hypothetical protein [Kofleriaceae bacterium]